LAEDADAALTLMAEMVTATDEKLRAKARRLAGKIVLDVSRRGQVTGRGTGRLQRVSWDRGGDLDLDASLDAIMAGRVARRPPAADELVARAWGRPTIAVCLVVDRSGSMTGERLAAAALTAGACAWRAPGDHAVITFASDVDVLRPMDSQRPVATVVDALLNLRGHGTTALGAALSAAGAQLEHSRADRRVVVLLSDCRSSDEVDVGAIAARLPELVILAPAEDSDQAADLARRADARWASMAGVADAPAALQSLLGDERTSR